MVSSAGARCFWILTFVRMTGGGGLILKEAANHNKRLSAGPDLNGLLTEIYNRRFRIIRGYAG